VAAIAVFGMGYWLFGIGERPFHYAVGMLLLYAIPLVVIFGVAGLVWGAIRIYRMLRRWVALYHLWRY
jgi:hypothetical protein